MKTNWQTKKLGEVLEKIVGGGTPSKSNSAYWGGDIPWASVKDIKENESILEQTQDFITEAGLKNSSANLVPAGTLIIPTRMGLGRVVRTKIDTSINQDLKALFPKKELDTDYLLLFLKSKAGEIMEKGSGATVSGIRLEHLKEIEIPLPPLSTQKEIVKMLDEKMGEIGEAKRFRAEALADTEKILPQTLHEIFEEGKKNGWEEKSFDDKEILKMTSGGTPSRANDDFYHGNIPWLKSGELRDSTNIIESEEKISEEAVKNSSAKIFPKGTVLFAMYGATAGKIGILGVDASTNQAVAGMIPVSEKLDNKFLYYFLMKKREEIVSQAWGGAQPNLSQTILKTFFIPIPTLTEQQKIVAKLDALSEKVRTLRDLQTTQLADLKSLERAHLREAFVLGN